MIISFVQVWDVGTGQVIRHLKGFGMKVNSLLFAQDSTLMIGGSDDRSVRRLAWLRLLQNLTLLNSQVRIWDLRSRENAPTDSMTDASGAFVVLVALSLCHLHILFDILILFTHLSRLIYISYCRCHHMRRCSGHQNNFVIC